MSWKEVQFFNCVHSWKESSSSFLSSADPIRLVSHNGLLSIFIRAPSPSENPLHRRNKDLPQLKEPSISVHRSTWKTLIWRPPIECVCVLTTRRGTWAFHPQPSPAWQGARRRHKMNGRHRCDIWEMSTAELRNTQVFEEACNTLLQHLDLGEDRTFS